VTLTNVFKRNGQKTQRYKGDRRKDHGFLLDTLKTTDALWTWREKDRQWLGKRTDLEKRDLCKGRNRIREGV